MNRIVLYREKQVSINYTGKSRESLRDLARQHNVPRGRNTNDTIKNLTDAGIQINGEIKLKNTGAKLCVKSFGKIFEVKAIVKTDAEANSYLAKNPSTSLIDEDQFGNKYIAENKELC